MFKIVFTEPIVFKSLFTAISGILDEITLKIDEDGVKMHGLDRAHITFIDLNLNKEWFDMFSIEEPTEVSIATDELVSVMKRVRKDDIIELGAKDNNFLLNFEEASKRSFKIRMIESDYEQQEPPTLEFPAMVEIPFEEFEGAVKDTEVFSETLEIGLDKDSISFGGEGDFGDNALEYLHGENLKLDKAVKSRFTIEKVKEMLKGKKISNVVTIGIGDDMPLFLKLGTEEAYISFLLAPKIVTED